jgi:cation transport ATPase
MVLYVARVRVRRVVHAQGGDRGDPRGGFEIDFLMLVAALGAAALGELFEGALLLFLFSFGHSLEGFAMARARKAISG